MKLSKEQQLLLENLELKNKLNNSLIGQLNVDNDRIQNEWNAFFAEISEKEGKEVLNYDPVKGEIIFKEEADGSSEPDNSTESV